MSFPLASRATALWQRFFAFGETALPSPPALTGQHEEVPVTEICTNLIDEFMRVNYSKQSVWMVATPARRTPAPESIVAAAPFRA